MCTSNGKEVTFKCFCCKDEYTRHLNHLERFVNKAEAPKGWSRMKFFNQNYDVCHKDKCKKLIQGME